MLLGKKIKAKVNFFLKPLKPFLFKTYTKNLAYYYKNLNQEVLKDTILFESYHTASTTGNVYAIFKGISEQYPNKKIYWVYSGKTPQLTEILKHKNVEAIEHESKMYFKMLARANYLFNDTSFYPYFIKREEQIYVNTWHGTPLKTLGLDINNANRSLHKNIQRNLLHTDFLLMPNEFTAEKLITSHDLNGIFPGKVYVTGNARVDLNVNPDNIVRDLLKINDNKKIILFAPTWQKSAHNTTIEDIELLISNIEKIQVSVGNDYKVMLKSHYFIYEKFVELGLEDKIIPNWVDTNELLTIVDALITDYSSIFFDYLPQKKPIFFLIPDLEEYVQERGLYLDPHSLPGQIYSTIDDLIVDISQPWDIYTNKNREHINKYLEEFCYMDDGNAVKRSLDIIFENNKSDIPELSFKNDKKVIVMYPGGLYNNGITNSFINLTNNLDYDKYEVVMLEYTSVASKKEKVNNKEKINKNVHTIFSFSHTPTSYLNKINEDILMRQGRFSKYFNEDRATQSFGLTFKRLFGQLSIDTLIDFGGYNKSMNAFFAYAPVNNKVVYLHNVMYEEYEKKIKNKYKHKWNLKVIFSLYDKFSHIVSVAKTTNEENLVKINGMSKVKDLTKWVPVYNMIDSEDILTTCQNVAEASSDDAIVSSVEILSEKSYRKTYINKPEQDKINFVSVSRLSPEKNHLEMIEAFSEIVEKYPQAVLHIIGNGPLYGEVKKFIKDNDLEENIYLYGYMEKPYYFISQCDCLLLLSNYEGQGLVLLEALILGVNICGTNVPGIADVISENGGLLVEKDIPSMVKGMEKIILEKPGKPNFDAEKYNEIAMAQFESILS